MPSPDDTYYNMKRLHVLFALSSTALLAATVWMVAADHYREWKEHQRTFRDRVEPWHTEARIREEQSEEFSAQEKELEKALADALVKVPDLESIRRFVEALAQDTTQRNVEPAGTAEIEEAYDAATSRADGEARHALVGRLREHVAAAANRQAKLDRRLQENRAEFAEARSFYEAGVGEGLAESTLKRLQGRVDHAGQEVERLVEAAEAAAAHHQALSAILGEITQEEDDARRSLADHRAEMARLERAWAEQLPNFGKRLLRAPLIDAFGRPLAIDQIWLPELTIDYNFRQVARFDRCATCHQAIDKTVPKTPSKGSYPAEEVVTLYLARSEQASDAGQRNDAKSDAAAVPSLRARYGFELAPRGILSDAAPTVGLIVPRSPASEADLRVGDVIQKIGGRRIDDWLGLEPVRKLLLEPEPSPKPSEGDEASDEDGPPRPLEIEVRRGLPHPYCSHPRPDLFVGSLSPHPVSRFGCTICHDGQGSATDFKFASHTPNDPGDRVRWRKEYGWFWNPHWDFPMRPRRFLQSNCLKCHHEVTDLAAGERFDDPPAPKLLAGYDLIRKNGCFGCHEIRGVTASGERIGPDMRLEPAYHEAALELLADPALTDDQRQLAHQVVRRPEDPKPRRRLAALLGAGSSEGAEPEPSVSGAASQAAVELLAEESLTPGTMRKVGPSLRDAAGKLDAAFLDRWLRDPEAIRPDTRMPHFYGVHEHLDGEGLDDAARYEAVEIRAVTDYLVAASQPVQTLPAPEVVTELSSADRGKRLFLTQGCLACHRHADFPEGQADVGPNLSGIAGQLTTETGRTWLVSWIRDPARHSPRTAMPNVLLEPTPLAADSDQGAQADDAATPITDPAADVAAYLLSPSPSDDDSPSSPRGPLVEADLDELVLLHLGKAISRRRARAYLSGSLELTGAEARGDAVELAGKVALEKKIRYVGRRTIRKRGCYGCHDVPGLENAQPIGPALTDWGRKRESLLAFEQIHQFLAKEGQGRGGELALGQKAQADPDEDFYLQALLAHRREGFIWQKLQAPRSFDYKKTENKGYNERLTMGRFGFSSDQREAIITFVLGLVAEPPAERYVYQGDRRRRAIAEGRKVLDRYACAECHTLEMGRWQVRYDPEEVEEPFADDDFAFLRPEPGLRELEAAARPDRLGLLHAEAVGMPLRDELGELVEDVDDDDYPLYFFSLWEPLAIKVLDDWAVWPVGGAEVGISDPRRIARQSPEEAAASGDPPPRQIVRPTYSPHLAAIRPPVGGTFARLLFPHAIDEDKPAVMETWNWLPPPLAGEGRKVEPAWLHDYLLEPFPIRPSVVLRMPKYRMSPDEAGKLVDYFAAQSGVDFPYGSDSPNRGIDPATEAPEQSGRLDDAMQVVIDRTTFCAKCHLIGDFSPGGEVTTVLAPRLDRVAGRLRREYVRRWIANPKSLLPYTGMPVNFPPSGPPLGQDLLKGSSLEQLNVVIELLLGYDEYLKRRTSIRQMMLSPEEPDTQTEGE
ncbi:MAG: hypothetical protein ACYTG0_20950 [Planctomycetota bacterium]|jgi:cytochrome c2